MTAHIRPPLAYDAISTHQQEAVLLLKKILVVGGDERAVHLASLLESAGYEVGTIGLKTGDEKTAEIDQADLLLFPYPFAMKNDCVPTYTGLTLHPGDLLDQVKSDAIILSGQGIDSYVLSQNESGKHITLCYYAGSDAFLQMNADISAEASVYEAMQQTKNTIMNMTVLVIGYGLFGRATARRLKALGADVWVAARREQPRIQAQNDGMRAIAIADMPSIAEHISIVLNTVPAHVMERSFLNALSKEACILELASAPYGFAKEDAEALHIHPLILPALPAKYAPHTAAQALANVVTELIAEASK